MQMKSKDANISYMEDACNKLKDIFGVKQLNFIYVKPKNTTISDQDSILVKVKDKVKYFEYIIDLDKLERKDFWSKIKEWENEKNSKLFKSWKIKFGK